MNDVMERLERDGVLLDVPSKLKQKVGVAAEGQARPARWIGDGTSENGDRNALGVLNTNARAWRSWHEQ